MYEHYMHIYMLQLNRCTVKCQRLKINKISLFILSLFFNQLYVSVPNDLFKLDKTSLLDS